jgi:hypothetical protein
VSRRIDCLERAYAGKYHYDVDEDPETLTAYWRAVDRT